MQMSCCGTSFLGLFVSIATYVNLVILLTVYYIILLAVIHLFLVILQGALQLGVDFKYDSSLSD